MNESPAQAPAQTATSGLAAASLALGALATLVYAALIGLFLIARLRGAPSHGPNLAHGFGYVAGVVVYAVGLCLALAALFAKGRSHRPAILGALINGGAIIAVGALLMWVLGSRRAQQGLINVSADGDMTKVQELLDRGSAVNAADEKGGTALAYAVIKGHADVANLLIAKGADVNAVTKEGDTVLMLAAGAGRADMVDLLIRKGAPVNAKRSSGATALLVAATAGRADVVDLLLRNGADLKAELNHDATVLAMAALAGHADVVDLLLRHGADLHATYSDGATLIRGSA